MPKLLFATKRLRIAISVCRRGSRDGTVGGGARLDLEKSGFPFVLRVARALSRIGVEACERRG